MIEIAVLDDYQKVALGMADWGRLDGRARITAFSDHLGDLDALAARLEPFDVVVLNRQRTEMQADLIARLPNLKLIVTSGMWNPSIDVNAAAARGIPVSGTGTMGHPTAELTWALILSFLRHIPDETASVRAGGWQCALGSGLKDKVLGIVGLGRIGKMVAPVGLAFGMEVIAWSPNLTQARAAEQGVRAVTKDDLFTEADVVTVHMFLSEATRGLIGAADLARMKKSALLVNTARGGLIDEAALVAALEEKRIAGAALDVYDREPLPEDHPFRRLPNVLATPHVGYVIEEGYRLTFGEIVENIEAWLDGAPIRLTKQAD